MYVYPVSTQNVSDDFSEHVARGSPNCGTDYTAGYGSPVYAVNDGVISGVNSSPSGGGGRMIYLDLDDGNGVDYLHLSSIVQSSGHVRAGVLIGYSGASGYGSDWYYGAHLHISIRNRHGSHTQNAGNFDFDAMIRAQAEPVPVRRKNVTTLYWNSDHTWALGGDSPGTTANWIETGDQALANAWADQHGPSVPLLPSDFPLFASWYRQLVSVEGDGAPADPVSAYAAVVLGSLITVILGIAALGLLLIYLATGEPDPAAIATLGGGSVGVGLLTAIAAWVSYNRFRRSRGVGRRYRRD